MCIVKSTLRILTVENVGEAFNQSACRLRYTPRKLLIHPDSKHLIIGEADHAAIPMAEREDLEELATNGEAQVRPVRMRAFPACQPAERRLQQVSWPAPGVGAMAGFGSA